MTEHDPTHALRLEVQTEATALVERTRHALTELLNMVERHNAALREQHPGRDNRRGRLNLRTVLRPACRGLKADVVNGLAILAYNTPRPPNPTRSTRQKPMSAPQYRTVPKRIVERRGQVLQHTSDPRRFQVKAFLGRVEGVKRYATQVVKGTQLDAEKVLTELLKEARRGPILTASRQTVAQYAREVFLPSKRREVRPSTLENYEFSLEKHVLPRVGARSLSSMNRYALNAFGHRMRQEGVGERTRYVAMMTLKQVLKHSRHQGDYRL